MDQVHDVLDTLKIEHVRLEGQSLGGWVAMRFALAYPERVSRLVLTTTMGYRPGPGAVPGYVEQDLTPLRESSLAALHDPSPANIRQRLARIVADPAVVTEEAVAVRQYFYNDPAVNAVQQQLIANYLGGDAPQKHVVTDAQAAQITAPTLVYWGDKNPLPPAVGERLARTIPNASFYCAERTGHWAQFENHEVHNREVLEFLRRPAGSRNARPSEAAK